MSSYARMYINDREIYSYRNEIYPDIGYFFSPPDDALELSGAEAAKYAGDQYEHPDGDESDEDQVTYPPTAIVYRASVSTIRDRLDVLGFGEGLVREVFGQILSEEIERREAFLGWEDSKGASNDLLRKAYERELPNLQRLTYEKWKNSLRNQLFERSAHRADNFAGDSPLALLERMDPRLIVRSIVSITAGHAIFTLDVSDLIDGGWLDHESLRTPIELGHTAYPGPPIIITEGKFDSQVLKEALSLLKPHLVPFIKFLDYETGNEGGAAASVRLLNSFAAAGIANRIVAIFDNDSAAREAVMSIRPSKLPAHFRVLHYPHLATAETYPTLGPQGNSLMDVNGLAGSIELYLGLDVLTDEKSQELTPVQWKGYMGKVKSYQGEVINKASIQRTFLAKVAAAKANPSLAEKQDWSSLNLILDSLILALAELYTA
ncbi:HEPN/Toprim-associated domain-containing protein [Micromonospora rosaria]|uniref:HEPN/Toprim-associated domain-containing protein n=1 Tax=Micromonospora rosaria TaxID=47874 RepID=UPI0012F9E744|nr:HEPN/Toprim-associated domain-containing protein [Micromonospora rosaria]